MGRFFFLSLIGFAFLGVGIPLGLLAQENAILPETETEAPEDALADVPYPVGPVLLEAAQKDLAFRPDWAVQVPPDAFSLTTGRAASITVLLEEEEYRACWNRGDLRAFPIYLQGAWVQVQGIQRQGKRIQGLTITGDTPWELEVLRYEDASRFLARLTGGEVVFFLVFQWDHTGISETWYDAQGTALGFFHSRAQDAGEDTRIGSLTSYTGTEEQNVWYEYDSFGNLSEIAAAEGTFSALYYQKNHRIYPRYWERPVLEAPPAEFAAAPPSIVPETRRYTFQWDERGFLVGMIEASLEDPEDAVVSYFTYTVDSQGNWTERQEIRMVRRLGVLVPSPGTTVTRRITYAPGG
ncbi:MAG: hypothetical protein LBD74_01000 [Spirochaetaceae bacterium]|jgi:YD repeat-containing protein|nr:hypothetical protein [Spirochaetaceae bacterium]